MVKMEIWYYMYKCNKMLKVYDYVVVLKSVVTREFVQRHQRELKKTEIQEDYIAEEIN